MTTVAERCAMGGMEGVRRLGWTLVVIGIVIVVAGGLLVSGKMPPFGNLPGDIVIRREHFTLYVPIVSMLIISATISVLLCLMRK